MCSWFWIPNRLSTRTTIQLRYIQRGKYLGYGYKFCKRVGGTWQPTESSQTCKVLRDLLLRLSQDWHTYCTFQSDPRFPVPTMLLNEPLGAWRYAPERGAWLQVLAGHSFRSDVDLYLYPLSSVPTAEAFVFSFSLFPHRLCYGNARRRLLKNNFACDIRVIQWSLI